MSISTEPLDIIRVDDEAITIEIADGDTSLLVAGSVLWLTVKRKINDRDDQAIFQKEFAIVSNTDEYVMDLSNTETELPLGSYYADIQLRDAANKITTVYKGAFAVVYDITRAK